MKVVAFHGSPRVNGNTARMLGLVLEELEIAGIATERIDVCPARPRGCIACMKCAQTKNGQCALTDDPMNEWIAKMTVADGIILASPTYFANITPEIKAVVDRAGIVARVNDGLFKRKVGAAVIAVRRGGAVPAFDAINHMYMINGMIIPGSLYWNFGFGLKPGDVESDDEGLANARDLGQSMVWLIKKVAV